MDYKEKFAGGIKRNRKYFLIFGILWLLLVIVFVAPTARGIADATINIQGAKPVSVFIASFGEAISNPFGEFFHMFEPTYFGSFLKVLVIFTAIYLIAVVIGIVKASPKHEYTGIEHGSSGWSQNGEQYRVINKKEGIILAENNYLPLDKRGNINVLVVGRIRFSENRQPILFRTPNNV